ncbi:MAG: glycosyltransferase family 9 protein [Chlamydiae bacterium]|nr:glycosyltransferase family 9 protein [Chlamydiota bacterium]MBI3277863.1 glycosyltransferase family 9 protein [Chlamydiota bacterium]
MKNKIDPYTIQKILFVSLSNIGDAILTTPSLDLVHRFFPKAEVTVMVGPRAREIFEHHPSMTRLILYDKHAGLKEKLKLILQLKDECYDLVIDLKQTLLPFLIQPKFSTPLFRKKMDQHAALRHLSYLKRIGIVGSCDFILPDVEQYREKVDTLLVKNGVDVASKYVVIHPGAASFLKRWELINFLKLAHELREKNKIQVVIAGASSDQNEFEKVFPKKLWPNLVGELSLMELGALLTRAEFLIAHDSGPMHLAAALKTRVLAIFGPTDPKIYGPFGPSHRIVRLDLDCSPCMAPTCRIQTHDCLKKLEVEEVYRIANEILSSPKCSKQCVFSQ